MSDANRSGLVTHGPRRRAERQAPRPRPGGPSEIAHRLRPRLRFRLTLPAVSPVHARVRVDAARRRGPGRPGPSGVFVNDERVAGRGLARDGDVLWLGPPGDAASVMIQCRVVAPAATATGRRSVGRVLRRRRRAPAVPAPLRLRPRRREPTSPRRTDRSPLHPRPASRGLLRGRAAPPAVRAAAAAAAGADCGAGAPKPPAAARSDRHASSSPARSRAPPAPNPPRRLGGPGPPAPERLPSPQRRRHTAAPSRPQRRFAARRRRPPPPAPPFRRLWRRPPSPSSGGPPRRFASRSAGFRSRRPRCRDRPPFPRSRRNHRSPRAGRSAARSRPAPVAAPARRRDRAVAPQPRGRRAAPTARRASVAPPVVRGPRGRWRLVVLGGGAYLRPAVRSAPELESASRRPGRRIGEGVTLTGRNFGRGGGKERGPLRRRTRDRSRSVADAPRGRGARGPGRRRARHVRFRDGPRRPAATPSAAPVAVHNAPRIHGLSPDVAMPGERSPSRAAGWAPERRRPFRTSRGRGPREHAHVDPRARPRHRGPARDARLPSRSRRGSTRPTRRPSSWAVFPSSRVSSRLRRSAGDIVTAGPWLPLEGRRQRRARARCPRLRHVGLRRELKFVVPWARERGRRSRRVARARRRRTKAKRL